MAGPADAFLGEILNGRYRLEEHLDDGHFSHVYRATDTTNNQSCAVKLLTPSAATSPEAVVEFDSEARLLSVLDGCRNVLDLHESDKATVNVTINGLVTPMAVRFHVLELADGAVSDLLAQRHQLDWFDRLRLFRHVVAGVHQMHSRRIVHRDLKSSNALLFDADSRNPAVKISDLGRSCLTTEPPRFSVQQYVTGRGDLSFAPPELLWLQGDNDPAHYRQADLYLVGSVLFELATAQGITGMAVPNWHAEVQRAAAVPEPARRQAFLSAANSMRVSYQLPLGLLAAELPPPIQADGVALVRQMCDPHPDHRERRFRAERKLGAWSLEWVLRRVDIMLRNLILEDRGRQRKRKVV